MIWVKKSESQQNKTYKKIIIFCNKNYEMISLPWKIKILHFAGS